MQGEEREGGHTLVAFDELLQYSVFDELLSAVSCPQEILYVPRGNRLVSTRLGFAQTSRDMAVPEASTPHDLTQTLGSFMDRHLLVPLLNFLQQKSLYDKRELDEAKAELAIAADTINQLEYEYELAVR